MSGKRPSISLKLIDNRARLFIIGLFTLFPLSGVWNIVRLCVSIMLAFPLVHRGVVSIDRRLKRVYMPMIVSLVLPVIAVIACEHNLNITGVIHELERLLFYVLLIYLCWNTIVDYKYLYAIATLFFIVHFIIQILQYFQFEPIFDFIEKVYLESGDSGVHLSLAKRSTLLNFRSGSIFMNPNVYMVIPCTYLCLIFQKILNKRSLYDYLLLICTALSLLLTGSRTTIVVFFVITLIYLNANKRLGRIKWIIFFPILLIVVWIIFFSSLSESYRAFDVAAGLNDSLGTKLKLLAKYYNNNNPVYLLFGSLGSPNSQSVDFEWGYVYSFFGILGLVWYTRFLKLFSRNETNYPFLCKSLLLVVIMIGITATVLLCMPIFPYVCIIAFPNIKAISSRLQNNDSP